MHLDERIHKHLDQVDELEVMVEAEIERLYKSIDVDDLMKDPEKYLLAVADELRIVLDDFAVEAAGLGIDFGQMLKKMKDEIGIPDTENPNLNKDLNDKGNG